MIEIIIAVIAFVLGFYLRGTTLGERAASKAKASVHQGGGGPGEE